MVIAGQAFVEEFEVAGPASLALIMKPFAFLAIPDCATSASLRPAVQIVAIIALGALLLAAIRVLPMALP